MREHETVRDCLVFGVPSSDRDRTDVIVACVATDGPQDAVTLKQFLLDKLPGWQVPREWWFVESLGANPRGKTPRAEWRRRLVQPGGQACPNSGSLVCRGHAASVIAEEPLRHPPRTAVAADMYSAIVTTSTIASVIVVPPAVVIVFDAFRMPLQAEQEGGSGRLHGLHRAVGGHRHQSNGQYDGAGASGAMPKAVAAERSNRRPPSPAQRSGGPPGPSSRSSR